MKHLKTLEGMTVDPIHQTFVDTLLSDGEILKGRHAAGTKSDSSPIPVPYERNLHHFDLFKRPVKFKAYAYERLHKDNLGWSKYTWDDIELLENDAADIRGIDKILHLVKHHELHKGFRIHEKEYLFTDEIYKTFVDNAARMAIKSIGEYTPTQIFLIETTSKLSLDIANAIKQQIGDVEIIENFFQKNPFDLIGIEDIIDQQVQNPVEREKVRTQLRTEIESMRKTHGSFKSKHLRKRLSKFIWNLLSIDPAYSGEDIDNLTRGKDIMIIDDVMSSSNTTFNNTASIIGTLHVETAVYFAAISTS